MTNSFSPIYFSLLGLLTLLPSVAAHGFLSGVTIDGKVYKGNVPNNAKFASPIRLIDDIGPVKGADNPFLSCGQNAAVADVVADANPGSSIAFSWSGGSGQHWPHEVGPLMTYMAQCTGTTCDKFDASQAEWFKIDEVGKKSGSDVWVQQDIFDGQSFTVNLPKDIAPGDYLVRHEIIALHIATSIGGAEFYPSCTQVRIGGNGNGAPASTVSFPGAYHDTDPGIFDPDVFNPGSNYTSFPGPPLSNLVASSGSGSSPQSSAAPAAPSSSEPAQTQPAVAAAPNPPSSTGTCKKKRMVKRHLRHEKKHSWF